MRRACARPRWSRSDRAGSIRIINAHRVTRGGDVAMHFRRVLRADHHTGLIGHVCDAQGLGKACIACGVELDETDAAHGHEVARGEACPLALTVRQRYRRGFCQQCKIGWLQIPMQRFFEPKSRRAQSHCAACAYLLSKAETSLTTRPSLSKR